MARSNNLLCLLILGANLMISRAHPTQIDVLDHGGEAVVLAGRDIAAEQFTPKCNKEGATTAKAAKACQMFLTGLASQECRVAAGGWTNMCNGTVDGIPVIVAGTAGGGLKEVSAACSDVARGMDWIIDHCTPAQCKDNGCVVAGTNAAWGNGNFVLTIVGATA